MDEWVSMHGTRTFSFTIGEWFLGAMVVLSLLFPLLHYLVEKYRKPFFFFITVCYLLAAWKYNGIRIRFCPEVPYNMSILFKGYEFVLGMYLPGILGNGGKRRAAFFIPVVLLFLFCKDSFPVTDILKITVLSVSVFGSASLLEPWLQKNDHGFLKKAGAFTYPVYLVHHLVIYELTPVFAPHIHQTPGYLLLFFCELLLMVPLAYLVKKLSEMLTGKLKKTQ